MDEIAISNALRLARNLLRYERQTAEAAQDTGAGGASEEPPAETRETEAAPPEAPVHHDSNRSAALAAIVARGLAVARR